MMKVERKVLSELMKNSRRSDREIAEALNISQPTVSRSRKQLEYKGYIREYTVIPDFAKIGYDLMALTFFKLRGTLSKDEIEEARRVSRERAEKSPKMGPFRVIMAERGEGLGYNGVFISLHEDYKSFTHLRGWLENFSFVEVSDVQSFLVNLHDEIRYTPLTFSLLAQHILTTMDPEKEAS